MELLLLVGGRVPRPPRGSQMRARRGGALRRSARRPVGIMLGDERHAGLGDAGFLAGDVLGVRPRNC
jgi:hypothetical protein